MSYIPRFRLFPFTICVTCILAVGAMAEPGDLVGAWKVTVDSQLGVTEMDLVVNDDMTGTLTSPNNTYELSDISVEGNQVSYEIVFNIDGQELPATFSGTIDGDSISGEFVTEMGNATLTGARKTINLPGAWGITVESPLGTVPMNFIVNEDMSGSLHMEDGTTYELPKITQEANKVTYDVTFDIQGQQLPAKFEGTVDGDTISGEFVTDAGVGVVTGSRLVVDLLGLWDITVESQLGVMEMDFIVEQEDSGLVISDLGDFEATNIQIDGDKVTYDITFDIQGQQLPAVFEGTVRGDNMQGEYVTDMGVGVVTGTRATPELPGAWNLTVESALGTQEMNFIVGEDMSAKIVSALGELEAQDVQLAGSRLTYDVTFDIEGQQLPAKFEGLVIGDTMTGEYITEFGNGTVTGDRAVADIVGDWLLSVEAEAMTIDMPLTVRDDMSGTLSYDIGTVEIEKINVDGMKVAFDVTFDLQNQEVPASFDGQLEGEKLTGTFSSIMGDGQVTGVRQLPTVDLAGTWNFTVDSNMGVADMTLNIKEDMTGTLSFELGTLNVKNIQLDGNQLTFDVNFFVEGSDLPAKFEGTVENNQLSGEFISEIGNGTVTGSKVE